MVPSSKVIAQAAVVQRFGRGLVAAVRGAGRRLLGDLALGGVDGEAVGEVQLAGGHGVRQGQQVHLVEAGQAGEVRVGQQLGEDAGLAGSEVGQA